MVLFDEIEKAHPDVLNILLQVLDDGRITDAQGRVVNFENAVIIMTSNAGSDTNENLLGFGKSSETASKEKAMKALSEFLRPEFLGRVDDIIVFRPLDRGDYERIAKLMCDELTESAKEKGVILDVEAAVFKRISEKVDTDKRGAREIRNVIRREIEDAVVGLIVEKGKVGKIRVSAPDGSKDIKVEYEE